MSDAEDVRCVRSLLDARVRCRVRPILNTGASCHRGTAAASRLDCRNRSAGQYLKPPELFTRASCVSIAGTTASRRCRPEHANRHIWGPIHRRRWHSASEYGENAIPCGIPFARLLASRSRHHADLRTQAWCSGPTSTRVKTVGPLRSFTVAALW